MAEAAALSAESRPMPEVLSLRTMAETTLGPVGGGAATAVYLFLSYTLMTAYISKGSQILEVATHLPPPVTATAFCLGIGGVLFGGSARNVDALNQILTAGLLGRSLNLMFAVEYVFVWEGERGTHRWYDRPVYVCTNTRRIAQFTKCEYKQRVEDF